MLYELFHFLALAIQIYSWIVIIYVLGSWIPPLQSTRFYEVIGRMTEPYLQIFRRFIPPLGMIDISPIVAMFVLIFAQEGIWAIYNSLVGVM
ncbi:YggT family protein [Tuberibacillus sp. Marseille-P3662]|uniref:YggT family protein n=1 Tax=Tuberibacillus sp. Marseille-P3662 TaxID=1965358 RepID=UPI000A1CBCF3|nr:YggT family protein [Tuberibacillus sp. Marseille-P3662]